MNNLYFACNDCKIYVDAGYRWAYWQLEEPGIVTRGGKINVEAVLHAKEFWHPPQDEESRWLNEQVFPTLRQFLNDHGNHHIVFGTGEEFAPDMDDYDFEWLQVGYLPKLTVRYLVEVEGLKSWAEVTEYMNGKRICPAWWEDNWSGDPSPHEKGQRKFEDLVHQKYGS